MSYSKTVSGLIDSVTKTYNNIRNRILTESMTQEEIATLDGNRFYTEEIITLSNGQTKYISYVNPVGSGVYVALIHRTFEAYDGAARQRILWDFEITTPGTPSQIDNENNFFINSLPAMEVHVNPVFTGGLYVRETDRILSNGTGINKSGDIKTGSGLRVYGPGTGFIFEITNDENSSNDVKIAYTWLERPENSY